MRSYRDAITALNTLQTPFEVLEERRASGKKMDASALEEMKLWLLRSGHSIAELDKLNIIHVAGTKGKGTTCAFVNSMLGHHRARYGSPQKIGLYTSPHLVSVRERIMINSQPIGEHTFARCFFEVWDALESSALSEGRDVAAKPVYFRFLTLMSFHVFLQESVDVAVYEVGVGGAWDSTNLVEHPVVTGITMLGIDHVAVLGDTIEKIAWHKAGIFKTGVPAFTVPQVPGAAGVLAECARERDVQLETIKIDPLVHRFNLFPNEEYQRENVSLALALVRAAGKRLQLEDMDTDENATLMRDGIEHTEWRGRCETKIDGLRKWYLDGAHTVESLRVAGRWYSQQCSKSPGTCVLIFNQQSRPEAPDLLRGLQDFLSKECPVKFDHVIFSTNVTRKKTGYRIEFTNRNTSEQVVKEMTLQKDFAEIWSASDHHAKVHITSTVEEAIDFVQELDDGVTETNVFVTGSFHLVGGVLALLEGAATPGTA